MAITSDHYGTLQEAENYFAGRLHETAWTGAAVADRPKALRAATRIIDALNFKGNKHTVHELLEANEDAMLDEIRVQEAAQALEFPRGADTEVPEAIRRASYEIAHSLLDGKDPELELENLAIVSSGLSSVRTTYNRSQAPTQHLINLVPNAFAWNLLRPFLRDDDAIKLMRVS